MPKLTELVQLAHESNPLNISADDLAREALSLADEDDYADLVYQALRNTASSMLTAWSRQPVSREGADDFFEEEDSGDKPQPQEPRRNTPCSPADRMHGSPYYDKGFSVPGISDRVHFRDMTREYWDLYIEKRYAISHTYTSRAHWGESAKAQLDEYGVETSGEVPEPAVRELFEKRPDGDDDL